MRDEEGPTPLQTSAPTSSDSATTTAARPPDSSSWARQAVNGSLLLVVGNMMADSPNVVDQALGHHLLEVDSEHEPTETGGCEQGSCPTCTGCLGIYDACWPCSYWIRAVRLGVVWLMDRAANPGVTDAREQSRIRKRRQRDRERDLSRDASVTSEADGAGDRHLTVPQTVSTNSSGNPSRNPSWNPSVLPAVANG